MFSSKSFKVSSLTFRFLIHFYFIFVYGDKNVLVSFLQVGDVDNMGGYARVGAGSIWEISVPSPQFCYKNKKQKCPLIKLPYSSVTKNSKAHCQKKNSSVFSSRTFKILLLTFSSMRHVELTFVYHEIRTKVNFSYTFFRVFIGLNDFSSPLHFFGTFVKNELGLLLASLFHSMNLF